MSGKPETPDELLEAIRNARMTVGIAEEGSPEWRSAAWDLMNHTAALDFLLTQKEPLPANWHRAMTTVYLATAGEYSSFRVLHAFAREEDAEAYKLGDEVMELEVREGPVEVRRWYHLTWRGDRADRMGEDGRGLPNPYTYAGDERDFNGDEGHVEHRWSKGHLQEVEGQAHLEVDGWDLALVKKVYSEQRAQYLARQEGIA